MNMNISSERNTQFLYWIGLLTLTQSLCKAIFCPHVYVSFYFVRVDQGPVS